MARVLQFTGSVPFDGSVESLQTAHNALMEIEKLLGTIFGEPVKLKTTIVSRQQPRGARQQLVEYRLSEKEPLPDKSDPLAGKRK